MTRRELEALRPGALVWVRAEGDREVRARYHSHFVVGRGRSARTYVRVLLPPRDIVVRVSASRVLRRAFL